ncbi:unnamed protein product [Musa acuminata subsp. burmannicoides]
MPARKCVTTRFASSSDLFPVPPTSISPLQHRLHEILGHSPPFPFCAVLQNPYHRRALANHLRSPLLWHPPAHRTLHSGASLPRHGAATHQVCHAVVVSTLLLIFLSIYSACVEKIHTFCNVV